MQHRRPLPPASPRSGVGIAVRRAALGPPDTALEMGRNHKGRCENVRAYTRPPIRACAETGAPSPCRRPGVFIAPQPQEGVATTTLWRSSCGSHSARCRKLKNMHLRVNYYVYFVNIGQMTEEYTYGWASTSSAGYPRRAHAKRSRCKNHPSQLTNSGPARILEQMR